ncbi:MAG: NEW3 domain-containing protein [Candidatus Bipolaricaulia bacterium]
MVKRASLGHLTIIGISTILFLGIICAPAFGQSQGEITVTTSYTHVVVPVDQAKSGVDFSIKFSNGSDKPEKLNLAASVPEGWDYSFEPSGYGQKSVRAIYLPTKEMDKENYEQSLTFRATPPDDLKPGDFQLTVRAKGSDGKVLTELPINLTVTEKPAPKKPKKKPAGVSVSAETTTIEQMAGKNKPFEFSIDVKNEGSESRRFQLGLKPANSDKPLRGWRGYFTKGYQGTRIRDLEIGGGSSKTVKVHLQPPPWVKAGEYPINFIAQSGELSDSIELKAVISGTYELSLTATGDGRVNTKATAGKETTISLKVENQGSAPLNNVTMSSVGTPKGWNVSFNPERIKTLESNSSRTIDISIKPGENAIAGDYMLQLKASSAQSKDSLDYRVTVNTPTTWGWVGVVVVAVVVLGLFGVFFRLRRR